MSSAHRIAVRGIGYAALVLALRGFGPADEQPIEPGGGAPQRVQQIAAPQHILKGQTRAAASDGSRPIPAAGESPAPIERRAAPQASPTKPAGAPIAPQATPVPAAPENAALARSEQVTDQIQAPAIADDAAAVDEDAADRQKDRQRRIAIAMSLLMLNQ